jgi:3-oxoacyl-[acyl-carrier protein] reductase
LSREENAFGQELRRDVMGGDMILEGQVAVVTGSGNGIGKAIALRLAGEGADIAVLDIDAKSAAVTGDDIRQLGRRAVVTVADVSDSQAVNAAVSAIVAELGRLDVLVNNAGIEKRAPFLEITPEDWQRQVDVNLSGTFYWMQAAAREMAQRHYGRIVNLSSVAGLIGPIDLAAYGAAKAGITGLTRAAALDLADFGITVNAIAPGPIETELMLGVWSAEALRERPQHGAIARFGTVDEVAHTALFLASPESGFITGVTLAVDGGAVAAGAYMVEKYRRRKAAAAHD